MTPYDGEPSCEARTEIAALASKVISVLSDKPVPHARSLRLSIVQQLMQAALAPGRFQPEQLVARLTTGRVTPEQLVDFYIPETAQQLGVLWEDDVIGFASVAIATARLQGLVSMMATAWPDIGPETGPSVLFVVMKDDAHTLGSQIAVQQMRRQGADVHLLFGPDEAELAHAIHHGCHDLVLFSCSRLDGLATIAHFVKCMRTGIARTPPIVLGGLVLNLAERVKERTGADFVTNDIRAALAACDSNKRKAESVIRL